LHGRSPQRAREAVDAVPGAAGALAGDLSSIAETRGLANEANDRGRFDAVIHNAGIGYRESRRVETVDGLSHLFAINVLAPYLVTALMTRPARLIYLSSECMAAATHRWRTCSGASVAGAAPRRTRTPSCLTSCSRWQWRGAGPMSSPTPSSPAGCRRRWVARARPTTWSAATRPQAWLAVSDDAEARVSRRCFYHLAERGYSHDADDPSVQDALLDACAELTGVAFPDA
jgi:hypothetical protein